MIEINYFTPGREQSDPDAIQRSSPLQAYLPALPAGVAAAYIEAYTQPGDLILDPFCQTSQIIREGLSLGRRVLAANLNPVVVRAVELSVAWNDWPDRLALNTAFTHLTDSRKSGETLRMRLSAHYATRCPTCHKPAWAESFVWERDQAEPLEKLVRCTHCQAESRGRTDDEDLARAKRYAPRSLPYWLLLDRAVAPGPEHHDERERAEAVLAAYTPRSLAALADILAQFDTLPEGEQTLLRPLLLETLAEASAIHPSEANAPPPGPAGRLRSLKPPARFVERNVWRLMEERLKYQSRPADQAGCWHYAPDVDSLLARREPAAHLAPRSNRDMARLIGDQPVALVIGLPPDPNPSLWALSAVWSAWLWGDGAADTLRPLLSHRRADAEWLWRALSPSLGAAASTLTDVAGRLVMIHTNADDERMGGLALAGAGAGLAMVHALAEPSAGLRIAWQRGSQRPERQLDIEALGLEVMETAEQTALDIIRARGGPVSWSQLAAGIYQALAQKTDLLTITARLPDVSPAPLALLTHFVRGTFEGGGAALRRVEGSDHIWWTNRSLVGKTSLPLCDLVEIAVYDVLQTLRQSPEADLIHHVYRRFPGNLTPERALVTMCLESYTQRMQAGMCALREQDQAENRRREIESLHGMLETLGRRLGWEIEEHEGNRQLWIEKRTPAYTFLLSSTAQLGPYLLTRRPPRGTPVLIIPGGRAGLIQYKLQRNVQFSDAVTGAGWQFMTYQSPVSFDGHSNNLAAVNPHNHTGAQQSLPHRYHFALIEPCSTGHYRLDKRLNEIVTAFNVWQGSQSASDFVQVGLGL